MQDWRGKTVWIIGASSGIGYALALELAARGARLALSARREDALRHLMGKTGSNPLILPVDVSKPESITAALPRVTQHFGTLDSVIVLAAMYHPGSVAEVDTDVTSQIIQTNLMGTFHILSTVLPYYRLQKKGQIALCGSVAGYVGLPGGQPYSATKAAINNLAESLATEEKPNGIDVRLICPGFVETPMTAKNNFHMPMMIRPEEAAKAIADGLAGSAFEVHFPKRFTFLMKLLKALPYPAYFMIAKKIASPQ